ncbi:hypothetical protein EGH25_09870 [Haladaptatus sp. F3-133]|jgi:hypothetical protein|uniref:Sulfatase n=1 Tax=Halorutilus salinus TaxID=2487751 RepID=A0A9Q4C5S9_9EURY|nr:hypothetical protein [Halorutilus salinus]MCX2819655.1 hypothetical protein [Halorutilus salinus]
MGLGDWVGEQAKNVRQNGLDGVRDIAYDLYAGLWWLAYPIPRGTNVYDRGDWDVLVILDACRVDLLRSVADEYGFIGSSENVERVESVGSMSKEWMAKTFDADHADEVAETVYVTANAFSERILDEESFLEIDEVWRYAWDEEEDTVLPRPVTDRALHAAREHDPDRLIVHYVQPHHPFLSIDGFDAATFGPDSSDTVVDALRKGKIDRDSFMSAYRDNLRAVLDDLELLLSNVDGKVAVTADHGDALGEWGVYDHPVGFLHPAVRTVPWVEVEATDTGEHTPETWKASPETGDEEVTDRLRSLGYVG